MSVCTANGRRHVKYSTRERAILALAEMLDRHATGRTHGIIRSPETLATFRCPECRSYHIGHSRPAARRMAQ